MHIPLFIHQPSTRKILEKEKKRWNYGEQWIRNIFVVHRPAEEYLNKWNKNNFFYSKEVKTKKVYF